MNFSISVDAGGTFTDLVLTGADGLTRVFKTLTTLDDPVEGVEQVVHAASVAMDRTPRELLSATDLFIHATTRPINAVLSNETARTALLVTQGHRDILFFREGGRQRPFLHRNFPRPYVPRSLTFEIPERVLAGGDIAQGMDETAVLRIIETLKERKVEAVAVCLLWATVNGIHEKRIGELLERHLPGVPYTLSHELNPILREYRRAQSVVIDVSLKPLMSGYLSRLEDRLRGGGFVGRLLMVGSHGGMLDVDEVAAAPIHSLKSGPCLAPIAGRYYAERENGGDNVIVVDIGGTSCDVSLIRDGAIQWSNETWIGERFHGIMTGLPSVDARSIGAGGGSIAYVDEGGLLCLGPQSAGSLPGPACYGRGGTRPTVTDAAAALGYFDPAMFLGGRMSLDVEAAKRALAQDVAEPLGTDEATAAQAVINLFVEKVASTIEDICIEQGVDPRSSVIVGGGGATGPVIGLLVRRLSVREAILPWLGTALSASGAAVSDLSRRFVALCPTTSDRFDTDAVTGVLNALSERAQAFFDRQDGAAFAGEKFVEFGVEARYPGQVWEIEMPMDWTPGSGNGPAADELAREFHACHDRYYGVSAEHSAVEFVTWWAHAGIRAPSRALTGGEQDLRGFAGTGRRQVYFRDRDWISTPVMSIGTVAPSQRVEGPQVIESVMTTIVLPPGVAATRTANGSLRINLSA